MTTTAHTRRIAVIMERAPVAGRWGGVKWEPRGVVPDEAPPGAPAQVIVEHGETCQMLFPGLTVRLERSEAEGYLLNITSPQPRVFVLWRLEDEIGRPVMATVSYNEGTRWADSGEPADSVPLPPDWLPWIGEFVEQNYVPEQRKKKKRYASNTDRGVGGRWNG
jgi:hypothetical protein